jgi:hypothetical protein
MLSFMGSQNGRGIRPPCYLVFQAPQNSFPWPTQRRKERVLSTGWPIPLRVISFKNTKPAFAALSAADQPSANQESEDRDQESEDRDQESEDRDQESGDRSQGSEDRRQKREKKAQAEL